MKEEAGCFCLEAVIMEAWTSGGIDAAFLSVALKVAPDDFCHPGFFLCTAPCKGNRKNLSEKSGRSEKALCRILGG